MSLYYYSDARKHWKVAENRNNVATNREKICQNPKEKVTITQQDCSCQKTAEEKVFGDGVGLLQSLERAMVGGKQKPQ